MPKVWPSAATVNSGHNSMNPEKLRALQIASEEKQRPKGSLWAIFIGVFLISGTATYLAWPRAQDQRRVKNTGVRPPTNSNPALAAGTARSSVISGDAGGEAVLTVSGYIINRER